MREHGRIIHTNRTAMSSNRLPCPRAPDKVGLKDNFAIVYSFSKNT